MSFFLFGSFAKSSLTMPVMLEEIETQPWYFGFLTRDHVTSHLLKPGDWCVRCSGNNEQRILWVVTKVDETRVRDFKLVYLENQKGWTFDGNMETFRSITELLSAKSSLSQKMNLRNPIKRPNYLLNDENLKMTFVKLGTGHYAEVFKGTLKLGDKEVDVAVKSCIIVDKAISISDKRSAKEIIKAKLARSQMIAEARLVFGFAHENIIKMYGVACNFAPIKLVMEYCPGGSLQDLLIQRKEAIISEERNIFLFEAAKALRHLQLRKFVHRDVAARNCLIASNGLLKLSDFGLSRSVKDLKGRRREDEYTAWPIAWLAPEALTKMPKFTTKSDVYAFGILIYEVYSCGAKPWPGIQTVDDIIPIVRKGGMMNTPPLLKNKDVEKIMRDCWKQMAVKRPDFIEIVNRFRAILRSQKLPAGWLRAVNSLKGVDSSKTSINLEQNSEDSKQSKQREMDEKAAQKMNEMNETAEEPSMTDPPKGTKRASAPCIQDKQLKRRGPSFIRASRLRGRFRPGTRSASPISATNNQKFAKSMKKWMSSSLSSSKRRPQRFKKPPKNT